MTEFDRDSPAPIKGLNLTKGQMFDLKQQALALGYNDVKSYMEYFVIKRSNMSIESLKDSTTNTVYNTIIEALPHVVWVTDKDGSATYVNRAWITWTGRSINESLGHGWIESLHPDDVDAQVAKWEEAYKHGKSYHGECRFVSTSGNITHCSYVGIPVKDNQGKVTNWIGINFDITERKNYEQELKNKVEILESRDKELVNLNKSIEQLTKRLMKK